MLTDSPQNLYLISINVTNKMKERFFHEYVPEVLDVSFEYRIAIMEHIGLTLALYRACKI